MCASVGGNGHWPLTEPWAYEAGRLQVSHDTIVLWMRKQKLRQLPCLAVSSYLLSHFYMGFYNIWNPVSGLFWRLIQYWELNFVTLCLVWTLSKQQFPLPFLESIAVFSNIFSNSHLVSLLAYTHMKYWSHILFSRVLGQPWWDSFNFYDQLPRWLLSICT